MKPVARRSVARGARGTASALSLAALLGAAAAPAARAQVVFDGSLGEPGLAPVLPFPGGGVDYRIDDARGETVGGTSLFHSFSSFDVPAGDAATFTGLDAIDRVYARVTGGEASDVFGALRSEIASADLYLLNPDGVIFGRDARLDIKGSFHVATAEALHFPGGERFEARAGGALPALAVDPPEAFGFLPDADAGSILVDGSQLFLPEGETFAAVAGELELRGRAGSDVPAVRVRGGRIELAAAAPGALVPAEIAAFDPAAPGAGALGAVELAGNAILEVTSLAGSSARGSGRIVIRGGHFAMQGGQINAIAQNAVPGEAVALDATVSGRLEIAGGARVQSATGATGAPTGAVRLAGDSVELSGASVVLSGTSGPAAGAEISVSARELRVEGGAQLATVSSASATGAGGAIAIAAETVALAGTSPAGASSQISSLAQGSGAGGELRIQATGLEIGDRAQIAAETRGAGAGGRIAVALAGPLEITGGGQIATRAAETATGRGGDLELSADSIRVATGDPARVSQIAALTLSRVGAAGAGAEGGALTVHAGSIDLEQGGQIRTTTLGTGPAGDLEVRARGLLRASGLVGGAGGSEATPSGLFARSAEGASGPGGSLRVGAEVLELEDGAEISARSFGAADAGDLLVEGALPGSAALRVTVRGGPAGESTLSTRGDDGASGNLSLRAQRLELVEGGVVSASTVGRGDSGLLRIEAEEVLVSGTHPATPSGIFAQTLSGRSDSGDAGNVELAVSRSLRVEQGGRLSVASRGGGSAGDLTISGGGAVELASGSEISARVGDTRQAAASDIRILGASSLRLSASTLTAETTGSGPGGAIELRAGSIRTVDGSLVSARSSGVGDRSGDAGDVTLAAQRGFESIASAIATDAESAGGGRISISAGTLVSLVDSSVKTDVRGRNASRDAGNIEIPAASAALAGEVPELVVLNRSSVTANAFAADAGNIVIASGDYLQSEDSRVEATSVLGINGIVALESPNREIASQLTALPVSFVDASALLTTACAARTARTGSFVVQTSAAAPAPATALLSARLADAMRAPDVAAGGGLAECPTGKEIR